MRSLHSYRFPAGVLKLHPNDQLQRPYAGQSYFVSVVRVLPAWCSPNFDPAWREAGEARKLVFGDYIGAASATGEKRFDVVRFKRNVFNGFLSPRVLPDFAMTS